MHVIHYRFWIPFFNTIKTRALNLIWKKYSFGLKRRTLECQQDQELRGADNHTDVTYNLGDEAFFWTPARPQENVKSFLKVRLFILCSSTHFIPKL